MGVCDISFIHYLYAGNAREKEYTPKICSGHEAAGLVTLVAVHLVLQAGYSDG
jgi:hypothetical protein